MDDKENTNMSFNIFGGNNQILPNATTAIQNFYDGRDAKANLGEEKSGESVLTSEAAQLSLYINKVEDLNIYLAQIMAAPAHLDWLRSSSTWLNGNPKSLRRRL